MNVVFAGGGTGGHLYPAIAMADALRDRGDTVTFVGTAGRMESTIVPKAGYPLATVASRPLRRDPLGLLRAAAAAGAGTLQSIALLRRLRPDLLVATGGYVCFPVMLAARALRATGGFGGAAVLFEPNAVPGRTNRTLAPMVDEIWGAFDADRASGTAYVRTGTPVRASLRRLPTRDEAIARLGLSPSRKVLLALGGSQGARTINDALIALLRAGGLPAGWQLLHLTGESEYDRVRGALAEPSGRVRAYLDDPADAYAAADLVLCRAGASTLAELAATGRPAILVPYPHAAGDHQTANARRLEAAGAAVVLADREVAAGKLPLALAQTAEPSRLAALTQAARRLAGTDPIATILARVDVLAERRSRR